MRYRCLLLFAILAPSLGFANEAEALLATSYLFSPTPILVLRLEMTINEQGGSKHRELELSVLKKSGSTFSLSRITSPAFLSDMKFLKRSEAGQADAQWIKTSKGLRRLGEGNRSELVFGSHFTVEDFGSISPSGFVLSLDPVLDTKDEVAVLARPRGPAAYADRLILIWKGSGLVTRMEYRDASGRVTRRYSVKAFEGSGADLRPKEAVMEDLAGGGSTLLKVLFLSSPPSLAERLFNPGSL